MTELEMELALLRYNMLTKKEAIAAYMCQHTDADECIHYGSEFSECTIETRKMKDDLRKYGYNFAYAGSKTAGKVQYAVYRIVAIATAS